MSKIAIEIIFIAVLLVGNGLFAMAEMALVASRKSRLQAMAEDGEPGAKLASELANAPGRFLSTVQVGITLINVLAGAIGTSALPEALGAVFQPLPFLGRYAHDISLAIIVALITFFSVLIGELVPKRLALNHPETIAKFMAGPMDAMSRSVSYIVNFLNACSDILLALMGVKKAEHSPVSEEEVRVLIDQGLTAGVFKKSEKEMVEGVLNLDEQTVDDLMTPRAQVIWLNIGDEPENNWRKIAGSGHSHFPVYQGTRDNVVGLVSVKSLWANISLTGNVDLKSVVTAPLYVPTTMPAGKLIEEFKKTRSHIALAVDEFGSVQGVATLKDVMEAIVGQLPEKELRNKPQARKRDDGTWLVDAMMETDDAKAALGIRELSGEDEGDYQTLGGFVLQQLGHIPAEGETVKWKNFQFEILDMDRQRIDKILVKKLPPPGPESEPVI
ncbi:MAG: hemolysin family protein [Methylacidiphilales bacterium]|nr:hemolysin family protein [Candidatus Methylacidiphilales bacterium]